MSWVVFTADAITRFRSARNDSKKYLVESYVGSSAQEGKARAFTYCARVTSLSGCQWHASGLVPFQHSASAERNAVFSTCSGSCRLKDARWRNVLAPSNVVVAYGVLRIVQRAELGRGSLTRRASLTALRGVGAGARDVILEDCSVNALGHLVVANERHGSS